MGDPFKFHHDACKAMLGDVFREEVAPFIAAIRDVEKSRGNGIDEAAATCAQVAIDDGEDPIIASMFFAAAVEMKEARHD